MRRWTLVLAALLALALAACFDGEPEVSVEEQVDEEQRAELDGADEEEAAEDDEEAAEDDEAVEAEETVTFVAVDMDFTEAPDTVPAGVVAFELVNEGAADHDVTIEELGDEEVVFASGGDTAVGEVELEPGEYTYYCAIPGHREAGMEGTFTVE